MPRLRAGRRQGLALAPMLRGATREIMATRDVDPLRKENDSFADRERRAAVDQREPEHRVGPDRRDQDRDQLELARRIALIVWSLAAGVFPSQSPGPSDGMAQFKGSFPNPGAERRGPTNAQT